MTRTREEEIRTQKKYEAEALILNDSEFLKENFKPLLYVGCEASIDVIPTFSSYFTTNKISLKFKLSDDTFFKFDIFTDPSVKGFQKSLVNHYKNKIIERIFKLEKEIEKVRKESKEQLKYLKKVYKKEDNNG